MRVGYTGREFPRSTVLEFSCSAYIQILAGCRVELIRSMGLLGKGGEQQVQEAIAAGIGTVRVAGKAAGMLSIDQAIAQVPEPGSAVRGGGDRHNSRGSRGPGAAGGIPGHFTGRCCSRSSVAPTSALRHFSNSAVVSAATGRARSAAPTCVVSLDLSIATESAGLFASRYAQ